jgi:predicted small metal-binding protein
MAEYSAKCPICNNEISADTESALVKQFQQHAKETHNRIMSERETRRLVSQQLAAARQEPVVTVEYSAKCPICGNELAADSEGALIEQFQQHAKEKHDNIMSERQVRRMIGDELAAAKQKARGMANHSARCPICNNEIVADSEDALVEQFQRHARDTHNKTMSAREVKQTIRKHVPA